MMKNTVFMLMFSFLAFVTTIAQSEICISSLCLTPVHVGTPIKYIPITVDDIIINIQIEHSNLPLDPGAAGKLTLL